MQKTLLVKLNGAGERGVRNQLMAFALATTGSREAAADLLGVSRGTIFERIKDFPADTEPAIDIEATPPKIFRIAPAAELELWLLNRRSQILAEGVMLENRVMKKMLEILVIVLLMLPLCGFAAIKSPRAATIQTAKPMAGTTVGTSPIATALALTAQTNAPLRIVTIGSPPSIGNSGTTTLKWDASPDQSVVGYRIYYGITSGKYTNSAAVGNVLTANVSGLREGQQYFYAATAYNDDGVESVFSNEASNTIPFRIYGPTPSAYDFGSYGKNGVTNTFQYSTNGGTTWKNFGTAFKGDGKTYRTATFQTINAPNGIAIFRIQAQ